MRAGSKYPLKICLVTSAGGHFIQLYKLKEWWSKYKRFWVTFKKEDTKYLLKGERVYHAYYPTVRSVKNLILNFFLALCILGKERPNLIISMGAGVSVPFFYVGKLFGSKLIYITVYDRINTVELSAKLVYPIADYFIIQRKEQEKFFPKGEVWGKLL